MLKLNSVIIGSATECLQTDKQQMACCSRVCAIWGLQPLFLPLAQTWEVMNLLCFIIFQKGD